MNLREIYTNKARVSRHASDGDFDDNLMDFEDFEQAIADYEKSKWVTEEYPLDGQTVIFTNEHNEVLEGTYDSARKKCIASCDRNPYSCKAWQPLPTTPKP